MLPEERQNMIVQLVNEHGAVSVKELSARFAVTDDSIRKDLALLQKNGRLKKTYGGALRITPDEDHFVSQRKPKYRAEKQRIAKKALKLLHDGETIFLDISTTNIELAKLLKTSGLALTVVTNMVDVMTTMAGDAYHRLIFIGGTFSEGCDGFVGALTNRELARYHFDKAFLGVDKLTTSMIRIENPDGELISDYAPFDGWFNTKGEAETWQDLNAEAVEADKAGICVKFFQAVENGSTFEVCDMNNADEVGKTYTVRWQLVNGEKAVRFVVNVTFVEFQQPIYKPEIIATVDVPATMKPAKDYEGATATFDAAAIAEALGLTTLADARAYIVNVTDGNFVDNFTDGWRNADGDAAKWNTSAAMVCVKVSDPASGIIDYLGAIDTSYAEGSTYTAKWGFVNDDEKAVVMNVNITFTDGITDAIQAPETASRTADVYNLQGQKLRHAAKGLNIVGGRKVIF